MFKVILTNFSLLFLIYCFPLIASQELYVEKCGEKYDDKWFSTACQDSLGSILYDFGQLWFDKNRDATNRKYEEKDFEARLKSEKIKILNQNYEQLLSYFWDTGNITVPNYACNKDYYIGEKKISETAKKKKFALISADQRLLAKQKRRELTKNLIIFQRTLNEIDTKGEQLTIMCTPRTGHRFQFTELPSCSNFNENKQRLLLARNTILNNYPILDTAKWEDGVEKYEDIFNKPSDDEVKEEDRRKIDLYLLDNALLEIQDNLLKEVKSTCEQDLQDIVKSDLLVRNLLINDDSFTGIYCREYNKGEAEDVLKTSGLITSSIVAVVAAPLSGGSSIAGFSALIAGGGAVAIDAGIAISDISNYQDIKQQFLSNVSNATGDGQFTSYEEKNSAYTQAIVSSVLTGAGSVANGIGIFRTFKGGKTLRAGNDVRIINSKEIPIIKTPSVAQQIYGKGYYKDRIFRDWIQSSVANQGWKLHVSATKDTASHIAEKILPILRKYNINHKVVESVDDFENIMTGTQRGKFITIYPDNDTQAKEIARILDRELSESQLAGYIIPGERPLGNSGLLYTRYGGFTEKPLITPSGAFDYNTYRGEIAPSWVNQSIWDGF